ncbi:hypothetical protein CHS0354_010784 [Potamilus streckersoni]|uniref:VWFA domain-containing protein n=1 Tax=Potamilus streckersoni TaxID=2493646 RepID=A0AAE0W992_9BIVA|nr:hypothetical protein CHS0354_010784 [Potamilus streckersoni]
MSSEMYEIVFSFDTTGSMYHCLTEVRRRLRAMIQLLKSKIPGIKIAIFCHGDYCDKKKYGYVTRHVDFTSDADKLCSFVESVQGTGGHGKAVYELVMREVQEKLM